MITHNELLIALGVLSAITVTGFSLMLYFGYRK